MTGKNRIMIYGPKDDGTYVIEFRTSEGDVLAIWPNMTLHSYRVRWGEAEPDPYYAELEKRQKSTFPLRPS
jgi:hypothetical protein